MARRRRRPRGRGRAARRGPVRQGDRHAALATNLLAARAALRDRAAARGEEALAQALTPTAIIARALIGAVADHPYVNASVDLEREQITMHREVHLGVALAAPEGLMVPVIHDAVERSIAQLATEIARLAAAGRAMRLRPEELTGATIIINNYGGLGVWLGTPIIQPPQVVNLGVGAIRDRVVPGRRRRRPRAEHGGAGPRRGRVPVGPDGLIPVGADGRATPRIAAIGDVVAGPALAHKASAEAIVAAEALSGRPSVFEPAAIPAVIFTDPEIATVGLTEAEAREQGMDARVATFPLAASGRAGTLGERDGLTRVVADAATDRIVGVHMVGPHVSELAAGATLAIEMVASPGDLAGTIHPHLTLSKTLHEAAELLLGRPIHVAR